MMRNLFKKRLFLVATALVLVTILGGLFLFLFNQSQVEERETETQKEASTLSEFLRENSQLNRRAQPIAFAHEKLEQDGGEQPEGSLSDEKYKQKAYPASDIDFSLTLGSQAAFQALTKRTGVPHSQWWQEVGPTIGNVPAEVTYTGVGTVNSGRITALAVSSTCGSSVCRVWVGAAGGGLWSTNNGLAQQPHWQFSSDGLGTTAIGSILIDPTDPTDRTLYVGTGEPNGSADSGAGLGLFKSTDYGMHWSQLQGSFAAAQSRAIASIAVDPTNANHIYIGTTPAVHGIASTDGSTTIIPGRPPVGLWESTDGGVNFNPVFTNVTPGHTNIRGVTQVTLDPRDPSTVYIGAWGDGIWRRSPSLDSSSTNFKQVLANIPAGGSEGVVRPAFALTLKDNKTRIYATLGFVTGAGTARLFRNDNADQVATTVLTGWTNLSSSSKASTGYDSYNFCTGQCWYDMVVGTPPGAPDTVYLAGSMLYNEIFVAHQPSNGRAVQRSTNAGVSFTDMTNDAQNLGMHPDQHAMAFINSNPDLVFFASDGGLVRTDGNFVDASAQCDSRGLNATDLANCKRWLKAIPSKITSLNSGLGTLQFQSISVNPKNPLNDIMGGTQDNGTWAYTGPAPKWQESVGGDGGQSGVDALNSNTRFHTYYGPQIDVNFNGTDPYGWNWTSDVLFASGENYSFYIPIISDPKVGGTMFAGLESVWRTTDNGGDKAFLQQHCNEFTGDFAVNCGDWQPLGGSNSTLTRNNFGTDRAGGYVAAVERANGDTSTTWAATSTGRLFVSKNVDAANAASVIFSRIDENGTSRLPNRFISGIAIDPKNANHAFVSYTGYSAITPATPGHLFDVTFDPGTGKATWKDISYDLGDLPLNDVVLDDVTGDLYVASDFGVAQLSANTTTWVPASPGLPTVEVSGLTIVPQSRTLYAATHGRGAWSLNLGK